MESLAVGLLKRNDLTLYEFAYQASSGGERRARQSDPRCLFGTSCKWGPCGNARNTAEVDLPSRLARPSLDVYGRIIWSAPSASSEGYARAVDPCVSGVATMWMSLKRWA